MATNYVFGYGSLLERASRTRTNPDAIGAWPARVTGFERGWYHQFKDFVGSTCTFLGATQTNHESDTINGVIYAVADIESTKKRERDYEAVSVDINLIQMLDGGGNLTIGVEDVIYIFVTKQGSKKEPSAAVPMVQSYVDMCINGCLELEALYRKVNELCSDGSFTREFILTTSNWSDFWVNDRIHARRPLTDTPKANDIDKALDAGGVLRLRQPPELCWLKEQVT